MQILFRVYFTIFDGDYGEYEEVSKLLCASNEKEFETELSNIIMTSEQGLLMYYKCSVEDI